MSSTTPIRLWKTMTDRTTNYLTNCENTLEFMLTI